MGKSLVSCFFETQCILLVSTLTIIMVLLLVSKLISAFDFCCTVNVMKTAAADTAAEDVVVPY